MARDPSAVETPKRKELGGTRSRSTEWGHVDVDTFVSSSLHIMIIMLHESLHMRQHLSLICACGIPSLIFWWPWNCALLLFSNACGSMVFFLPFLLSLSLSRKFSLCSRNHSFVNIFEGALIWLVVWNMNFMTFQLGTSSSQLTNSYFSEGWLKHQPVMVLDLGCLHCCSNGEQGPGPVTCWHWIGGFVYQHDV